MCRLLLLVLGLAATACANVKTEGGVRGCDRNGDYEQRMACQP
jgi:hypothetical protein